MNIASLKYDKEKRVLVACVGEIESILPISIVGGKRIILQKSLILQKAGGAISYDMVLQWARCFANEHGQSYDIVEMD